MLHISMISRVFFLALFRSPSQRERLRRSDRPRPGHETGSSRRRLTLEWLEGRLAPATLVVNSTADTAHPTDPYLSLREAVVIANSPSLPTDLSDQILGQISGTLHEDGTDTILFDPGAVDVPIVLGGTQLELTLPAGTASITIDGGEAGVTVDGHNASRVFQVDTGVRAAFGHLTVTHGRTSGTAPADYGGGIYNVGTLTVSHSTLSANSAFSSEPMSARGGGIYNASGALTVTDSTLSSNSANSGGGIFNLTGTLTVSQSDLSVNSGGIDNSVGTATVSSSILSSNPGGGIANGRGMLTVTDSTLSANSGGIHNVEGTVIVSGCTLSANSGVGISNVQGTVAVSNSTLSANSSLDGGGISNSQGAR
jgi:hypothetical protein